MVTINAHLITYHRRGGFHIRPLPEFNKRATVGATCGRPLPKVRRHPCRSRRWVRGIRATSGRRPRSILAAPFGATAQTSCLPPVDVVNYDVDCNCFVARATTGRPYTVSNLFTRRQIIIYLHELKCKIIVGRADHSPPLNTSASLYGGMWSSRPTSILY